MDRIIMQQLKNGLKMVVEVHIYQALLLKKYPFVIY